MLGGDILFNYIYEYLLNFGYVFLTSLPYYTFFIIMYFILKKTSSDKDISKRFYNSINSEKENKFLNFLEIVMNYICNNALVFCMAIIIVATISVLFYELDNKSIFEYMISAAALRLQKYIFESLLTIVIAVVGSVAIFSSLDKKYYLIFSSKDIIKSLKIKENIITIFLFYFICIISISLYYTYYYIFDNIDGFNFVKVFLFCVTIVSSFIIFIWILKLFYSVMKFIFSNKTENKLLETLHYNIRNEKSSSLYISDEYETRIKCNLDYLFSIINKNFKIKNEKIYFVSFLKEYNNFDKKLKRKLFLNTYILAIIFNLICTFYIYKYLKSEISIPFIIIYSIILNLVICCALYKTNIRNVLVHIQMWSWGFLIEKDDINYYSSTLKNNITNKNYDEYFKNLYNIICLFKDVLSSNKSYSKYCLREIIKFVNDDYSDYILYAVCVYLYYKKYGKEKTLLLQLKEFIISNGIEWDLLEINITALINDIFRYDSSNDVKKFIYSVKNSDRIVTVKIK